MKNTFFDRRTFLKTSGVAVIGSVAPYYWTTSQARAESKNDRPLVAAIGVGGRGDTIGRQASAFGDMVACADVDRAHAEAFAGHFQGRCRVYGDYRKLLDRKDIEAVTIATPDHWHAAIAIAALKAGKDVYCEKPLALTIAEGKRICEVVKETGQIFQVGTQQRSEFDNLFLKAVALVRSGRLGTRLTATCTANDDSLVGGPFANMDPPPQLDWDFWLGQAPKVPYCPQRCHQHYRFWLEYAGGKIADWGAHTVDTGMWALGLDHTGPVEVEGVGNFPNIPNGYNTANTFDCTCKFANGLTLFVKSSPKDQGCLIEGENGRIFVNRGRLSGKPIEELTAAEREWLDQEALKFYKGKHPGSHMRNFFECLKDRSEPQSDVFTNHRSISICHLCNIAMRLKRKLRWDPVKENFIGDAEASAMVSRPRREKYPLEM